MCGAAGEQASGHQAEAQQVCAVGLTAPSHLWWVLTGCDLPWGLVDVSLAPGPTAPQGDQGGHGLGNKSPGCSLRKKIAHTPSSG